VYVQTAGGAIWGPKPQPGTSAPVGADGTFTLNNWNSGGAGDANAPALLAFLLPAGAAAPGVLGANAVPASLTSAALASTTYSRAAGTNTPGGGGGAVPPAASPSPPQAASQAPPAGTGAQVIVNAPGLGAGNPVTGRVQGVNPPYSQYKLGILVSGNNGGTWWDKTHDYPNGTPQAVVLGIPINADGTFTITGWVSDPNDLQAGLMRVILVPQSFSFLWPGCQVEGVPWPNNYFNDQTVLAMTTVDRATGTHTYWLPGGGAPPAASASSAAAARPSAPAASAAPPAASPAAGTGKAASVQLSGPGAGSAAAISGKAANAPAGSQAWVYVQTAGGAIWGPKPQPGVSATVGGDGSFTLANWNSGGAGDAAAPVLLSFVTSPGQTAPSLMGAQDVPPELTSMSLAGVSFNRASGVNSALGTTGAPTTAPSFAPPASGTGELPWPPTAVPGNAVGQQGGMIQFAGYSWIVKDSGGGGVGPGNNIFSNSMENVWTDSWGLHLNIIPTNGCGRWTCSEVWLDHALGWGVYLFRFVGPVEFVDPDVTWSPFFIWDDSANAGNGFREIDFEMARWGNAGDPTSSQFVLRPLQAGGMVPGWRVRYQTKAMPAIISGNGQGGGNCYNRGADNFNGMGISKTTCVLKWFQNKLEWYCYDGLWTMQSIANAPISRIMASYIYPQQFQQFIPDQGDARVHINHWLQNGYAPRWGRRSHSITNGFEFSKQDINFPNFPTNSMNIQNARLLSEMALGRSLADSTEVVDASKQSSGDPTGQAYQLTQMSMQSMSAADYTGAAATAAGQGGGQLPAGAIAGIVVGAVVGGIAMFVAGMVVATRAKGTVKATSQKLFGSEPYQPVPVVSPTGAESKQAQASKVKPSAGGR